MRRLLLLVTLVALVVPATADATWPRAERAKAVAAEFWDKQPDQCPGVWTLRADLSYAGDGREAEAWMSKCTIRFDRAWLQALRMKLWDRPWMRFCSLYVHEWGHLLGLPHSDDPSNVMYATPPMVRACWSARKLPSNDR